MEKDIIIKDKRMANTLVWLTSCRYKIKQDKFDNTKEVYVFKKEDGNVILRTMKEIKDIRIRNNAFIIK